MSNKRLSVLGLCSLVAGGIGIVAATVLNMPNELVRTITLMLGSILAAIGVIIAFYVEDEE